MNRIGKRHLIIPDTQLKKGVPMEHLEWIGKFIVDERPDVIICLGDWADMHSLSKYDAGKRAGEGARYEEDIEAAREGMELLLTPLSDYNRGRKAVKAKQYKPRRVLTLGNHENRINKHVDSYPILEGRLSVEDLGYARAGWEVHDFLEVVEIDGVQYSHYFPRGPNGRILQLYRGAPSAQAQVRREMQSSTAGHLQGLDFHIYTSGQRRFYGLIAGSCYLHDEDFLGPEGNNYWRGVIVKNEVKDGEYDACFVSLNYLELRYG